MSNENGNRTRLARERAGLSLGQAAKLLGMTSLHLEEIEGSTEQNVERAPDLAALYHVSVEWMTGKVERYDYKSIKSIPGSEDLSFHDRDTLAEFAASMPRRKP
jgi:transcriptional regulator with XRE-family HTH domain